MRGTRSMHVRPSRVWVQLLNISSLCSCTRIRTQVLSTSTVFPMELYKKQELMDMLGSMMNSAPARSAVVEEVTSRVASGAQVARTLPPFLLTCVIRHWNQCRIKCVAMSRVLLSGG
uniref:Uncharacterized protein n=1 Tax=Cacopsylla melanoneura TaxID=428564 RepID=A0A8D8TQD7_9HEMI